MLNWNEYIVGQNDTVVNRRSRLARINNSNSRYLNTNSQKLLNFVSNDYLGLGSNPKLVDALTSSARIYGVGSSGAPSLSGYSKEHQYLSEELASWLQYDKCLLFNSGFQLNLGIFAPLVDNNTKIWLDRRCHASHIDGVLLTRAKFVTFTANEIDEIIISIKQQQNYRHLVISEGSFSMDGTCTYWDKLLHLKKELGEQLLLVLDDAHGVGALGENGYGTLEQLGLSHKPIDIMIGTLGKAFGTHGGFVCGNQLIIDYLQQSVRSQIFSTNLPPCIAAASKASLNLIRSDYGHKLRTQLANNITYFHKLSKASGLNIKEHLSNQSPIQLLVYQDDGSSGVANIDQDGANKITKIHQRLLQQNILVGKIIYPTVAKNTPRLRISLNAEHTQDDLNLLINNLVKAIHHDDI